MESLENGVVEYWRDHQRHMWSSYDYFKEIEPQTPGFIEHAIISVTHREATDNSFCGLIIGCFIHQKINVKLGYLPLPSPTFKTLKVMFGGLLGDVANWSGDLLPALSKVAKENGASRIEFDYSLPEQFLQNKRWVNQGLLSDTTYKGEPNYVLDLVDDFDGFYQQLSNNAKSNVRKYRNRLQKQFSDQINIVHASTTDEVLALFDDLEYISNRSVLNSLGVGFERSDLTSYKWKRLSERGELTVHVMHINDAPAAYWVAYHVRDRVILFLTGFDQSLDYYHPGYFLLFDMIDRFSQQGRRFLEYGYCFAEYKRRFSTREETVVSAQFFVLSFFGVLGYVFVMPLKIVTRWLDAALDRYQLKQRLRKWWRTRLAKKL